MNTIPEIKAKINRDLYPISTKDIPKIVRSGKMPETQRHLKDFEIDFRSLSAWNTAYVELINMSSWDRFRLTNP